MDRFLKLAVRVVVFAAAITMVAIALNFILPAGLGGRGPFDNSLTALGVVAVVYYLFRGTLWDKPVKPSGPGPDSPDDSN